MAARTSGSKIVAAAVAATVTAVGVGSIYLPFFADRDTIRGLHEEQAPPTAAMLAQEIKKLQRDGILKGDDDGDGNNGNAAPPPPPPPQRQGGLAPGSMWKNMK